MICPKCSFDQSDAYECIKCGVVIAKYLTLRKRREESDNKLPALAPPPAILTEDTLWEEAPRGSDEESQQIWGEIHYIKADTSLLTQTLRGLQERQEDLSQAIAQCASQPDVKKMSQDIAEVSHALGAMYTTMNDLSVILESLSAVATGYPQLAQEVDRLKNERAQPVPADPNAVGMQRLVTQLSGEIEALKDHVANHPAPTASPESWSTELADLRSELTFLQSEWQQTKETMTDLRQREAEHTQLATDLFELRHEVAALRRELADLKASVQAQTTPEWDEIRAQFRAEMQSLSASGATDVLSRLESIFRQEVNALHERVDTLAAKLEGMGELKASLAGLSEQLQQVGATPVITPETPLEALRERFEALAPRVAELDEVKASLADLSQRLERSETPRAELTALAPRVETLEVFRQNVTKTLEKLSGPGAPDTQLGSLKQWAERLQPGADARTLPEAGAEWREVKEDIKLIKLLLSDFMKQSQKSAQ